MPRARLVSHPTLVPLGQPEKAMGRESQIEPWLAPDNRALLVGLRTDWLCRKEAMKTADRGNQKRYAAVCSVPSSRNGRREQSCSMGRAGGQENIRPQENCFFLTPFIELIRGYRARPDEDEPSLRSAQPQTPAVLLQTSLTKCGAYSKKRGISSRRQNLRETIEHQLWHCVKCGSASNHWARCWRRSSPPFTRNSRRGP
jgi:hypothetical protein